MDHVPEPQADHRRHRRVQGVVVVEGKTDAAKVARLFPGTQTIAVGGSAVAETTISLIKAAASRDGVVLLFDPDYQGEKIRRKVAQRLTAYRQAFIDPECFKGAAGKHGVAEAPDEAVIAALAKYAAECDAANASLTWEQYLDFGLDSKAKRLRVCKALRIAYANHKRLFKLLNLLGIGAERLKELTQDA